MEKDLSRKDGSEVPIKIFARMEHNKLIFYVVKFYMVNSNVQRNFKFKYFYFYTN